MIRVNIICEGQTETQFVKTLLLPHFAKLDIYFDAALIGRPGKKGGNVKPDRLLTDLRIRLLKDRSIYCTTFFDFYGLPTDFPGKYEASGKAHPKEKAATVCSALQTSLRERIDENLMRRFIPYVQMFEFEGLLFSDPANFAKGINKPELQSDFAKIRGEFDTPEHINDSQHTAPSKRIKKLVSRYRKPTMGENAAKNITLEKIRQECPLFDAWLKKLESLQPLQ